MAQHTPGPWSVKAAVVGFDRDFGITAPGCEGPIAECFERFVTQQTVRPEEASANASLVAAAPELLAAAKAAYSHLRAFDVSDGECCMPDLRAAIAKATGEPVTT